jgi:hypothetical protein
MKCNKIYGTLLLSDHKQVAEGDDSFRCAS